MSAPEDWDTIDGPSPESRDKTKGTALDWRGSRVAETVPSVAVPHWVLELESGESHAVRDWGSFRVMLNRIITEEELDSATEEELRDGIGFTVKLKDIAPEDIASGDWNHTIE